MLLPTGTSQPPAAGSKIPGPGSPLVPEEPDSFCRGLPNIARIYDYLLMARIITRRTEGRALRRPDRGGSGRGRGGAGES